MAIHIDSVTHVALHVNNLREAESYYCGLFDLEPAWRAANVADEWRSLPEGKTWDDAEAAGIALDLVFLHRAGFGLALESSKIVNADGRLSHIGLLVNNKSFQSLRERLALHECQLHVDERTTLVFDDKYGVRWEPTTLPYDNPKQQSDGAARGMWLDV